MSLQTIINYDTAGNFTFNSSEIEIVGSKAQLKKQTYANETFFADFTDNINGRRGGASLIGTGTNSPTITGNKLDLTGESVKYVSYAAGANTDFATEFTAEGYFTPDYTGSPSGSRYVFSAGLGAGTNVNYTALYHHSDGFWYFILNGVNGTTLANLSFFDAFSMISGTPVFYSFNVDTDGNIRLFLDGTQNGPTRTSNDSGNLRTTFDYFNIGTDRVNLAKSDFLLEDFRFFNNVQHISGYTVGAEPTDYLLTNPTIINNSGTLMDGLDGFAETSDAFSGTDNLKSIFVSGSQDKYFDTSNWVDSDGTYAQANTAAEIETNKAALDLSAGVTAKFKYFLHAGIGYTTPALQILTVDYNFYDTQDADVAECIIYVHLGDLLQDVTDFSTLNATLQVTNPVAFQHGDKLVLADTHSAPFGTNGTAEISVMETTSVGKKMQFKIAYTDSGTAKTVNFKDVVVPSTESANLLTLTKVVTDA